MKRKPIDFPIFIAGHKGMVGSAIVNILSSNGYKNIITANKDELDLSNQSEVEAFFQKNKPSFVIICAAKVGGIKANSEYPAEFIYQNLMIQCNLIHSAYTNNIKELIFLGSSCVYPKFSEQPIREDSLLKSSLEPTNEAYALAKISGIKLCEFYSQQYGLDYRSLMPTNLYGPRDNFSLEDSHVIPALLRKFHEAKHSHKTSVEVWGSGQISREFMHVDDLAEACMFIMNLPKENFYNVIKKNHSSHINVGTGNDITIKELSLLIKDVVGYAGKIHFNEDMPDGTPRKLLDVSCMEELGWKANIRLKQGLSEVYNWYQENQDNLRK